MRPETARAERLPARGDGDRARRHGVRLRLPRAPARRHGRTSRRSSSSAISCRHGARRHDRAASRGRRTWAARRRSGTRSSRARPTAGRSRCSAARRCCSRPSLDAAGPVARTVACPRRIPPIAIRDALLATLRVWTGTRVRAARLACGRWSGARRATMPALRRRARDASSRFAWPRWPDSRRAGLVQCAAALPPAAARPRCWRCWLCSWRRGGAHAEVVAAAAMFAAVRRRCRASRRARAVRVSPTSCGREWEGADVASCGVVDDLPQRSEQGARFAFAVESVVPRDVARARRDCRSLVRGPCARQ